MQIIEQKDNQLFNRKEIKVLVEAQITPSKFDAEKSIAEHFKSEQSNIVINNVKGKFGRKTFLINAKIYNSPEDKENFEPKKKIKKKGGD